MEAQIQAIKDQIPISFDAISLVMVVGISMGLFLSLIILTKSRKEIAPLVFFGLLIFCASLISLDIFLCYTGLMKEVLFLNDSTETLVLLLGPFIYLFLYNALEDHTFKWKKHRIHFILPFLYFLTQVGFFIEDDGVKLNAYLTGFHPELNTINAESNIAQPLYDFGKENLHELIIISFTIYSVLSFLLLRGRKNTTSIQHPIINKLAFSRNAIIVFSIITLVLLIVFAAFDRDDGDPYIVIVFTLFIIMSNYLFSSSSRIFQKTWLNEKYQSSGMVDHPASALEEVSSFIKESGFALQQNITLQSLSDEINIPANYISQAINAGLGINFNEFINQFRIEKAIEYLQDPQYSHLNIEGIGQSVGFKSKSSFYSAFKKRTGSTPSAYLKELKTG